MESALRDILRDEFDKINPPPIYKGASDEKKQQLYQEIEHKLHPGKKKIPSNPKELEEWYEKKMKKYEKPKNKDDALLMSDEEVGEVSSASESEEKDELPLASSSGESETSDEDGPKDEKEDQEKYEEEVREEKIELNKSVLNELKKYIDVNDPQMMMDDLAEKYGINKDKIQSDNFFDDVENDEDFYEGLEKDFVERDRILLRKEREQLLNKKRKNKEFSSNFLKGNTLEKLWEEERKKS